MNQRYDPSDNRFVDASTRPGERAIDPVTGAPVSDKLASRDVNAPPLDPPKSRSNWPVLIILLAGLVIALLVWLPSELNNSTPDTATQPAATADPATPPAATAPAATEPAAPPTAVAPDAQPMAPAPATPDATPPATGTQPPATGTAP